MKEIYLVSACRTAVGSYGGALKSVPAVKLGSVVISGAIERAGIKPDQVDEVVMGNVLQAGLGQNPARQAMIYAGLPVEVPAETINMVCGSGLRAVSIAAQLIKAGDAECVIAGGMESMSKAPYVLNNARWGARMGNFDAVDEMITDGLFDAFNKYHMGITAENVAEKYGVTREAQDEFSASSQEKAAKALETKRFADEIVPIEIPQKKGDPIVFDTDEFPRPGTTAEKLSKLKPAFKKDGTVTAGNASGINDGAAAFVVASKEFVVKNNLKPIAKVVSYGSKGLDPAIMGLGPIGAVKVAMEKTDLTMKDMDLIEANEAFAAQAVEVVKELEIPLDKVNVNGGAIALGHPIGASGARILTSLAYELKKRDGRYGLATLCIGGGMGTAVIIERDELCK